MTRLLAAAAALLSAAILSFFGPGSGPDVQTLLSDAGIEVFDGDTISVPLDGKRTTIRYLLIDSPELHHPRRAEEELALEASEANRDIISSGPLRIEFDKELRDRYERLLAYVWVSLPEGETMVNEELVRRGLALPLIIPPNGKYADRIFSAMEEAARNGAGLWSRSENRIFTASQVWAEATVLAGSFVTVSMILERVEERGRRIILSQGRLSLTAYRNGRTAGLLGLKKGERVTVRGKVLLSPRGCEIPIVSVLQVSRDSGG